MHAAAAARHRALSCAHDTWRLLSRAKGKARPYHAPAGARQSAPLPLPHPRRRPWPFSMRLIVAKPRVGSIQPARGPALHALARQGFVQAQPQNALYDADGLCVCVGEGGRGARAAWSECGPCSSRRHRHAPCYATVHGPENCPAHRRGGAALPRRAPSISAISLCLKS